MPPSERRLARSQELLGRNDTRTPYRILDKILQELFLEQFL